MQFKDLETAAVPGQRIWQSFFNCLFGYPLFLSESIDALMTNTMTKLCVSVFCDICLNLIPKSLIITNLFAI